MLDHLPRTRHAFQALGHVLAELPERATALRAGTKRRIDDPLAREVLRQWPSSRLAGTWRTIEAPRRWCGYLGRYLLLGRCLLELGELQLELGDDLGPALGGLAVLLASGFGEQQLQPLDLQPGTGHQGLGALGSGLGLQPRRPFGEDHRVRRGEVSRQRMEGVHAEKRSISSTFVITLKIR
jgi:hypothetical protein